MILTFVISAAFLALDVKPEVFWQRISMAGESVGYQRIEYSSTEEGRYRCVEEILVMIGGIRQRTRGEYLFDGDLRPVSFSRETFLGDVGEEVRRCVTGTLSNGKLAVHMESPQGEKESTVDFPADGVSRLVYPFVYGSIAEKAKRVFSTYNAQTCVLVRHTASRAGTQVVSIDGREVPAIVIEETNSEKPTITTRVLFLPPGGANPNGRVHLFTLTDSTGSVPETSFEGCGADEAEEWVKSH